MTVTNSAGLGYSIVDLDNHYYEPDDCFTRHISADFADRAVNVRRGEDGLGRVFLGDRRLRYLSVTQTDWIQPPGALEDVFAGRVSREDAAIAPICPRDYPEFMQRESRLATMTDQGIEAAFMLPSLGVTVLHELADDVPALHANLTSFNRWIEEDWGYGDGRIFGVPMMSLMDVDLAVIELERLIAAGARAINFTPGPFQGRSPADPHFDPFWARVQEAGLLVSLHIGDSGYNELFSSQWSEHTRPPIHRQSAFQLATCHMERPIVDTLSAMVLHNLFGRFPGLRVISIENGSEWVAGLIKRMDKAVSATQVDAHWVGGRLTAKPSEVFREHIYVVPFHEDDVTSLVSTLGSDRVIFGSDYPHPEGLAQPIRFTEALTSLSEAERRQIMRGNAARLLGLTPG